VDSLLVLNKRDKLSPVEIAALKREFPDAVFLSTREKASVAELHSLIQSYFERGMVDTELFVPYAKSAATAEIHATMRVLSENHEDEGTRLRVKCMPQDLERLKKQFHID
jgi:GTP-binding protein HflX